MEADLEAVYPLSSGLGEMEIVMLKRALRNERFSLTYHLDILVEESKK